MLVIRNGCVAGYSVSPIGRTFNHTSSPAFASGQRGNKGGGPESCWKAYPVLKSPPCEIYRSSHHAFKRDNVLLKQLQGCNRGVQIHANQPRSTRQFPEKILGATFIHRHYPSRLCFSTGYMFFDRFLATLETRWDFQPHHAAMTRRHCGADEGFSVWYLSNWVSQHRSPRGAHGWPADVVSHLGHVCGGNKLGNRGVDALARTGAAQAEWWLQQCHWCPWDRAHRGDQPLDVRAAVGACDLKHCWRHAVTRRARLQQGTDGPQRTLPHRHVQRGVPLVIARAETITVPCEQTYTNRLGVTLQD